LLERRGAQAEENKASIDNSDQHVIKKNTTDFYVRQKIAPIYRVSSDFMSVLQDLISEVIPSQKCHMNKSPILSSYRATDF
jgi:hypothetical protein